MYIYRHVHILVKFHMFYVYQQVYVAVYECLDIRTTIYMYFDNYMNIFHFKS
jgi:hypothetical protein